MKMDKNTCCSICVKEFFKVSNLRRHIKKFHPESFVPLPKKHFAFTCQVCGKNFSYIRNFRSHQKMHDPNPPQTKTLKNCPLCDYTSDKKQLYQHFEKCHETIVVTELIEFPSFEHFMTWKVTLENDTKTNFIRGYTQQTKYYDEVILFVCHRSGHHFPKTKNIKFKNDVITKKIGGFCPASIKMMKKNDGSIKVSFVQTHVGHNNEDIIQNREAATKVKIMRARHKNSLNLSMNSIVKCDNIWQYHSQKKEEVYSLSTNDVQCEYDCHLSCEDCKTCVHKFSCTCKDWSIKRNMCVHIHLLCRVLHKELEPQKEETQLQQTNSNIDITDLIIYDGGGHNEQPPTVLREVHQEPDIVSIEEKNVILQEFSNILIKCNSPTMFQEIVTFVGGLKARLECEDILSPVSDNHFVTQ